MSDQSDEQLDDRHLSVCPSCLERTIIDFFDGEEGNIPPTHTLVIDDVFTSREWDAFCYTATGWLDVPEMIRILRIAGLNTLHDIQGTHETRKAIRDDFDERELFMLDSPFVLLCRAFDRAIHRVFAHHATCGWDD